MKKRLNTFWLITLFALFFTQAKGADEGFQISLNIDGYLGSEMIIAYHFGDKQYIKDTLNTSTAGLFTFSGEEQLAPGMYIAFFPDLKRSFEFLVTETDQTFVLMTKVNDFVAHMEVKGSSENTLFFNYLNYLNQQRGELNGINALLEQVKKQKSEAEAAGQDVTSLNQKVAELEEKLKSLDEKVKTYQKDLVKNNPRSFTADIIKINFPVDVPEEIRQDSVKGFYYFRDHFFDHTPFTERMVRTPMFHNKIDFFVSDKVTIPIPDSVIKSVDLILEKAAGKGDLFQFCLVRLLNNYAKSKIVCMDKVYVHLVDNYYSAGKADWLDEEQLKKIQEDANTLRPLLCGEIAPNVAMQTFDSPAKNIALHDVTAKYTVLFFWDPDCGHCKSSMPAMVKFYDDFKNKGVQVFAVCTKTYKDEQKCVEFIEEKDMKRWLNVIDPYFRSRYKIIYDIKSTPIIYILDKDKEIIAKKLGAEQLPEVMEKIIERDKERDKEREKASQKTGPLEGIDPDKKIKVTPKGSKVRPVEESKD